MCTWFSVGSVMTNSNWDYETTPSQPDRYSQQCLEIERFGRWTDRDCQQAKGYICMKGISVLIIMGFGCKRYTLMILFSDKMP